MYCLIAAQTTNTLKIKFIRQKKKKELGLNKLYSYTVLNGILGWTNGLFRQPLRRTNSFKFNNLQYKTILTNSFLTKRQILHLLV